MRRTPLLLLHGALGARSQLEPLAGRLQASHAVHPLEFEGHGGTPRSGAPFSPTTFASNILAFLDSEGVDVADVFGYSMGGYVALLLAASHPDRIRRIATLGTKFRWDRVTAEREASRLDPVKLRAKIPGFAETLAERHAGAGGWEQVLAATARLLLSLGDDPPLDDQKLGSIHQPACIMVGDRDTTVSVEEAEAVARQLPAGRCVVLPDSPHPLEQVDSELLAGRLHDFLTEQTG